MKEKLVSFIIPVYNIKQYVDECVQSILNQGSDGYEIVLVDDGSTDGSSQKCDEYANKDNVKVIHKQNGGLSSARNEGLKISQGKYIAFVDGDDRIAGGSLNKLLTYAEDGKADIVFLSCIKFYPDGRTEDLGDGINAKELQDLCKEGCIEYLSQRPKYPGSACTKLFKKEFLDNNNLKFIEGVKCEDLCFCLDAFLTSKKFDAIDNPYYEYRQDREGSINQEAAIQKAANIKSFVDYAVAKLCNDKKPKDAISKDCLSFVAYEVAIMLWRNPEEDYKKYGWILPYSKSKKVRLFHSLVKIIGTKNASKLMDAVKG